MNLTQKNLFYLALFTLFGFSAIGLAIIYFFQSISPVAFFGREVLILRQIILGTSFGLFSAGFSIVLIRLKWFKNELDFFRAMVHPLVPKYKQVFFYSLCAGVGEELLFRGGILPLIGLWPTSILFILIHGYLNPKKPLLFTYGIFMVLISAGLGWLFLKWGIFAAIAAHTVFDILIFLFLKHSSSLKTI